MARKKHIGSSFESFLNEEGILEEVNAMALKEIYSRAWREYIKKIELSLVSSKTNHK